MVTCTPAYAHEAVTLPITPLLLHGQRAARAWATVATPTQLLLSNSYLQVMARAHERVTVVSQAGDRTHSGGSSVVIPWVTFGAVQHRTEETVTCACSQESKTDEGPQLPSCATRSAEEYNPRSVSSSIAIRTVTW